MIERLLHVSTMKFMTSRIQFNHAVWMLLHEQIFLVQCYRRYRRTWKESWTAKQYSSNGLRCYTVL